MARNLNKIFSDTPDLDRVQEQVDQAIRNLNNQPLLRGTAVTVNLTTGSQSRIAHGLGRPWVGWFVTDRRQQGDLWSVSGANQSERYLTVSGSLGGRVSLWIF